MYLGNGVYDLGTLKCGCCLLWFRVGMHVSQASALKIVQVIESGVQEISHN